MTEPRQRYNIIGRPTYASSKSSTSLVATPAFPLPNDSSRTYSSRPKRKGVTWSLLLWVVPVSLIVIWYVVASWPPTRASVNELDRSHSSPSANRGVRSNDNQRRTVRIAPRTAHDPLESSVRVNSKSDHVSDDVLTIYMELPSTLQSTIQPLPVRTTHASKLVRVPFPNLHVDCSSTGRQHKLPIDSFPEKDPFLPWLHDYHVDASLTRVRFVAQNKRRCDTGTGKDIVMKYWEPQISLFQPIPVMRDEVLIPNDNGPTKQEQFRLATSVANATFPETRFLCHFHWSSNSSDPDSQPNSLAITTLSTFDFNYEYVMWRKRRLPMFQPTGSDVSKLEMSQLLFACPIPHEVRHAIRSSSAWPAVRLDLVPIRTPPRWVRQLFGVHHIGADQLAREQAKGAWFNASEHFGTQHILPPVVDSGRWANLPLCPSSPGVAGATEGTGSRRRHTFVACTWTAASYFRRGDATIIHDSASRLKEWIVFHQLVGVEHMYVYDNTKLDDYQDPNGSGSSQSPLQAVCDLFPSSLVTYIPWPASVCSNNRPNFQNPGERSSQYAADAACRSKYGDQTEWMTFLDTDEYLVPMRRTGDGNSTWRGILQEYDAQAIHVLKLKSSRGRPRLDLMDATDDPNICVRRNRRVNKLAEPTCVVPRQNATFLQVYNCDYIKHPRPERFSRAMKQIYRPASVLSHFVHYSIVDVDTAKYYKDFDNRLAYNADSNGTWDFKEHFLDELTEGVLVHAKSVLPHETMTRTKTCHNASKHTCAVGHACPDSVKFDDETHQMNLFHDPNGKYCNCWVDNHVEQYWVPKLELEMAKH